ncbi:ribosome maturation protein [Zychaea mexicana]|uniref:ribosome maturation protein n=1 Tax=Zychaea mexicana TaxID=64656 RepID=UPI0022FE4FAD|nr:ribosome maturation protein [Zychaea mexicana]KAI9497447.1 ribosome maturation protein [Zychaea mexicana]
MHGTSGENAAKIVYKGENGQEFFIVANPGMAQKWRKDKTIPLIDVVQSFDVLTTTNQSSTGEAIRVANGVLESEFGTSNTDDIVRKIVESGEEKGGSVAK